MRVRDCIVLVSLFFICKMTAGQNMPVPVGTKKAAKNLYCSKSWATNKSWALYTQIYHSKVTTPGSLLPDTTILYKGQKYYGNPKYKNYPVVGLTLQQRVQFCNRITETSNNVKSAPSGGCPKKYFDAVRRSDPQDSLAFQYFLPSFQDLLNTKYVMPGQWPAVALSDTILYNTTNTEFSKDSITVFRFAVRYKKR